jgi:cold shock CspA family protein
MSENGGDDDDFGERRSDRDRDRGPRRGGQREIGVERDFGGAPGGDFGGGGGGGGGFPDRGGFTPGGGGGGYRGSGDRDGGGYGGGRGGGGGGYGGGRGGGGGGYGGGRGGGGGGYGGGRGGGGYGGGDRDGGGGGGRFGGGGGGGGRFGGGGPGGGGFQDRGEPKERGPRQNGTLKFFNNDRGFGFITPENGGKDVFVHISAIERSGLQQLAEGTKLSFETEDDRRGRGPQAVNLQLVD